MTNITGIVKSARKIMRQDTDTGSDELLGQLKEELSYEN